MASAGIKELARALRAQADRPEEKGEIAWEEQKRASIASDSDIISVRKTAQAMAERVGFSSTDVTLLATAISELARNIVRYAKQGEIILRPTKTNNRQGIVVVARDNGPGIPDLEQALKVGYSTAGGLGLGLPGVRRLMDEFEIRSEVGQGTTVSAKKWKV